MPQIKESVTVNRPISEVFRYATNFNNAQEWQPDVADVHQTEERPRVGVMITARRNSYAMGTRLDLNADITDYSMNKHLEYKGVIGRFPATGRLSFESSGGTTTVRETIDVRTGCLFAWINPFLTMALRARTQRALQSLKQTMEAKSVGGGAEPTSFQDEL